MYFQLFPKSKERWEAWRYLEVYYGARLAERTFEDGLWNQFGKLLKRGFVTMANCPELVSTIIQIPETSKVHRNKLLMLVIQKVKDLRPTDVILLMKYFITYANTKQLRPYVSESYKEKEREAFIELILVREITPSFMQQALKALSLEEVMFLLKHLVSLLETYHSQLDEGKARKNRPLLPQVIQWLHTLFDSQFTQLVLTKEIHPILHKLRETTDIHVKFCKETDSIMVVLKEATKRQEKKEFAIAHHEMLPYGIEILKF